MFTFVAGCRVMSITALRMSRARRTVHHISTAGIAQRLEPARSLPENRQDARGVTHFTAAEGPHSARYTPKNNGEAAHLKPSFDTWKFWLSSAAMFAGLLTIALLPSCS